MRLCLLTQGGQTGIAFSFVILVLFYGQHPVAHPIRFGFNIGFIEAMAKCSAIRISLLFIDLLKQRHDGTPFQITRLHIQHFQQIRLRFKTIRRVIHTDAEADGVICCAHPTSRLESDRVALHHEAGVKLVLVIVQVRQHKLSSKIVIQVAGNRVQIRHHEIVIVACGVTFL